MIRRLAILTMMALALPAPQVPAQGAPAQGAQGAPAQGASAQAPALATLVADRVEVREAAILVATGNVEVLYRGTRVSATRITYDQRAGRLRIDGPITLDDTASGTLVLADQADLDDDLENGILTSARLVLDRQLQLAAAQVARVEGRYTRLTNTVASSCEVCAGNPVPTWEIRARSVIHDEVEQQLYFDNATFRLLGVPILYFPYLRLPDPTLTRTRGFLLPRIRTSSQLGTGLKLPYFVPLGRHADVTLTPYVTPVTRTLEGEYRQVFRRGEISFQGAISDDDRRRGKVGYYLFGKGSFDLPRNLQLDFDIQQVFDRAYLVDYGYSGADRLRSSVALSHADRDGMFVAGITEFRTLRDRERPIRDQLPSLYTLVDWERRIFTAGGEVRLGFGAASVDRDSRADGPGRDVDRLNLSADYRRSTMLANGIVGEARLGFTAASYAVDDDSRFGTTVGRLTPEAELRLTWPLARTGRDGSHHLLEPVLHLGWSHVSGGAVPNEDSPLVEFDEGNLLAMSRFPGVDGVEDGGRAALGLRYTRDDPAGWSLGATLGRIVRIDDHDQFTGGSGLDGQVSDWLAAGRLQVGKRLSVTQRALFDDGLDFSRAEARLAYDDARHTISSTYVWASADPAENRPDPTHEVGLDAARRLTRHWTGRVAGRFDLAEDRAADAGLGLEYRSECIVVDLSLSRRFTSSDNIDPSTDFGVNLSLAGFGSGRNSESYRKVCNAGPGY